MRLRPREIEALELVFRDGPEDIFRYEHEYGSLEVSGYVKRNEGTFAGYIVTANGRQALVKDRLMQ